MDNCPLFTGLTLSPSLKALTPTTKKQVIMEHYIVTIKYATAEDEVVPPITPTELAALHQCANTAASWALKNMDAAGMAQVEPVHSHMLRVTPISAGDTLVVYQDGTFAKLFKAEDIERSDVSSNNDATTATTHTTAGARKKQDLKAGTSLSGAGITWFQHPQAPHAVPHMLHLDAHVFSTFPEAHIIRRSPPTGDCYACIPLPTWFSRDGCAHCSLLAPSAMAPAGPLCEFHAHFARTGRCLSLLEQLALEEVARGEEEGERDGDSDCGGDGDGDGGGGWGPLHKAVFVELLRARLAWLRLLEGAEALVSLSADESWTVGAKVGAVGGERKAKK
jgi:hypothetical protein